MFGIFVLTFTVEWREERQSSLNLSNPISKKLPSLPSISFQPDPPPRTSMQGRALPPGLLQTQWLVGWCRADAGGMHGGSDAFFVPPSRFLVWGKRGLSRRRLGDLFVRALGLCYLWGELASRRGGGVQEDRFVRVWARESWMWGLSEDGW